MPALIFDYDGVLVDSERLAGQLWLDVLAKHDIHLELTAFSPYVGSTDRGILDSFDDFIRSMLPDVEFAILDKEVSEEFRKLEDEQMLMPGIQELLDLARAEAWPVGVATGKDRERLARQLKRLGIFDRFDAIVTAQDVDRGKPAPDIFLETARRMDIDPSDCVVVEDSPAGCVAALAAGMTVVACPCAVTTGSEFPGGVIHVASLVDVDLARLVLGEAAR